MATVLDGMNEMVTMMEEGVPVNVAMMRLDTKNMIAQGRDEQDALRYLRKFQSIMNTSMDFGAAESERRNYLMVLEGLVEDFDITCNRVHWEIHDMTL